MRKWNVRMVDEKDFGRYLYSSYCPCCINVIAAYVLWEHIAFMERRVKYLIEHGYLDSKTDLLDSAICIREKAENIQNMILKVVELYQAQETTKMVIAMMRGTELIDEIEKSEKSFIRNLIDALKENSQ